MCCSRYRFISTASIILLFGLLTCCLLFILKPVYLEMLPMFSPNPVPTLIAALDDSSELVRAATVSSIAKIGKPALDPLVRALKDAEPLRREGAAICIGQMALKRKELLPVLVKHAAPEVKHALDDPDVRVRVQAAIALWRINEDPKEVVPYLILACTDKNRIVRYHAFECLSDIGPPAADAIPTVKLAMTDDDYMVRVWATDAYRSITAKK